MSFFSTQQIQLSYTYLNRHGHYNVLMKNPLVKNSSFGIIAILLGIMGLKTYGYFIGHAIGQILTLIHMIRYLPKKTKKLGISDVRTCFTENANFMRYQLPSNILYSIKNQLPIILITNLWGTEIIGYYSIAVRLLQIPSSLLAGAVGRVFFNTISSLKRQGKEIGQYSYNNLYLAMKIGIVPIALFMAYGDYISILFLGPEWEMSGIFMRILSLQYYYMFLMFSMQGLSITINKQKYAMISNLTQIIGFAVGAYLGKFVWDSIYVALIIMTVIYIFIQIVYFEKIFRYLNIKRNKYLYKAIKVNMIIFIISFLIRLPIEYFSIIDQFLE